MLKDGTNRQKAWLIFFLATFAKDLNISGYGMLEWMQKFSCYLRAT